MIQTDELIFSDEVYRACARNACGRYGTSWACPPAAGEPAEQESFCRSFPSALFFSTCSPLEDSFDIYGMARARDAHTRLTNEIAEFYAIPLNRVLGAQACRLCKDCTYPNAPCRRPKEMTRTVESYGIDVVALCEQTGLSYYNGENTVTYFSLLLFDKYEKTRRLK